MLSAFDALIEQGYSRHDLWYEMYPSEILSILHIKLVKAREMERQLSEPQKQKSGMSLDHFAMMMRPDKARELIAKETHEFKKGLAIQRWQATSH